MAKQTVAVGSTANDGTGDPLRDAFGKVNDNFTEVYGGAILPARLAGNWVAIDGSFSGVIANGAFVSSGRIYYSPILITAPITISDLAARVSGSTALGLFALALYAHDNTTMRPTGTPLAATGDMSAATGALVTADITGANVTLQPGIYWQAVWSNNGAVAFVSQSGLPMNLTARLVGTATTANLPINSVYSSETFNSAAWPNATTEAFTEQGGDPRGNPIIYAKVA
jgi:hypothetical protein